MKKTGAFLLCVCMLLAPLHGAEAFELELYPAYVQIPSEHAVYLDWETNPAGKEILWSSSNPGVAAVDSDGLITAISPGEATIVAALKDKPGVSASCGVRVVEFLEDENAFNVVIIWESGSPSQYRDGVNTSTILPFDDSGADNNNARQGNLRRRPVRISRKRTLYDSFRQLRAVEVYANIVYEHYSDKTTRTVYDGSDADGQQMGTDEHFFKDWSSFTGNWRGVLTLRGYDYDTKHFHYGGKLDAKAFGTETSESNRKYNVYVNKGHETQTHFDYDNSFTTIWSASGEFPDDYDTSEVFLISPEDYTLRIPYKVTMPGTMRKIRKYRERSSGPGAYPTGNKDSDVTEDYPNNTFGGGSGFSIEFLPLPSQSLPLTQQLIFVDEGSYSGGSSGIGNWHSRYIVTFTIGAPGVMPPPVPKPSDPLRPLPPPVPEPDSPLRPLPPPVPEPDSPLRPLPPPVPEPDSPLRPLPPPVPQPDSPLRPLPPPVPQP